MGRVGRTLADALIEFGIGYGAVERDQRRFAEALADGYAVAFGDVADPRLWGPVGMSERRLSAVTAPSYEVSSELTPMARQLYPSLKRYALVRSEEDRERFRSIGMHPVMDRSVPPGLDLAGAILAELGIEAEAIGAWKRRQQERALGALELARSEDQPVLPTLEPAA
jgi:CPA2 family monovalent cation:H+ antiporter-2